jgi:hypothetical protein
MPDFRRREASDNRRDQVTIQRLVERLMVPARIVKGSGEKTKTTYSG